MNEKTRTMDLVNGPIAKTLIVFSVPFMLSMLLQTAYSTTDTIIVGQYLGSAGLSAVSNGSQLMQMLTALCIGFANAGQVLIAQAKGAGNYEKLEKIIGTLFVLEVFICVVIGTVCVVFSRGLLNILNTPAEAYVQARWYIMICGGGLIFTGLYNLFSAMLRGMGDSRHPLLFVILATVLNVFLDILFIAGFNWNVAGAALATIIGQAVSVVFSLVFLLRHTREYGIDFSLKTMRPDAQSTRQLFSIGAPMALQLTAVQISFLFVGRMINALGVTVSAAFGVMQKIRMIPNFITSGFGQGAASMMGQNLGAKKLDRVDKIVKLTILVTGITYGFFVILYLTVPELLFRIFTQDETVLEFAAMTTLVLAIEAVAHTFMPACNSLVSAQGFVKLSFTVAILDAFLGRIFFCWLLGSFFGLGAFGYFLGYICGTYITSSIVLIYYLSGKWKKRAALV